jgi:2-polyprenyl-3-methyl-5-hydroxy-6-metoxy-1,4-benzoquinol methylase
MVTATRRRLRREPSDILGKTRHVERAVRCLRLLVSANISRQQMRTWTYLDVGCGDGTITDEITKAITCARTIATDIESPHSGYLRIVDDRIPFETGAADFVTCFMTLHHLENFDAMMREISRTMKLGAYLYVRDHNVKTTEQSTYIDFIHLLHSVHNHGQRKHMHMRYTSKEELTHSICSYGFSMVTSEDVYLSIYNPQMIYHALFRKSSDVPQAETYIPKWIRTDYNYENKNLVGYYRKNQTQVLKCIRKILGIHDEQAIVALFECKDDDGFGCQSKIPQNSYK